MLAIVRRTIHTDAARTPRPGRVAMAVALTALLTFALFPRAGATFTATTGDTGNAFTAAASFPDYPTAVLAANPLAYYRLDDTPGSITAADSSTHGSPGVYGTANYAAWTGLWPMDEGSGATTADLSGNATRHPLTRDGATWTATGRRGSALAFDGTSAYADSGTRVLTTTGSFAVTAWVYLTDTSATRTAVSEDGANISAFELGYAASHWTFGMPRTDDTAATVDTINSTSTPSANTWTQLTATFNSGNNGMDLYVNGVHESGAIFGGTPWNASSALVVGAGLSSTRTHYWQGTIDSVRTEDAAVSAATAQELTVGPSGGPSTSWPLDENTGTTTVDYSGGLDSGTFGSSASWGVAKVGTSSVDLPGDGNGYVAGSGPAVDTSKSFTVAAWVYLDHTTLNAMSRVAVSQSGNIKSGFTLRYNHFGQCWQFAVTRGANDDYNTVDDSSYSSGNSAVLNTWTYLVGVYDANAQTVTLIVNGVAQSSTSHTSPFVATGPAQVGRVRVFGSWDTGSPGNSEGPWAGRVDEVKFFQRAIDGSEITALYNGGNPGSTLGVSGALQGAQQGQASSTALAFGRNARASYDSVQYTNPTTYSVECWFRNQGVPAAARGQTLIAFSTSPTGNTITHDRRIYLDLSGHVVAGPASSGTVTSPNTYADGSWHHVVVTVSPAGGVHLYVDGAPVAAGAYQAPANFSGYWRFGGDTWDANWPADYYWLGQLDEVAVYGTELSAQVVAEHYHANH